MTELLMALAGMLAGLMALLGVPALLLFLVAPLMGALPWLSDLG
tara:strand:- start:11489 stop:11620 length:132 start_codon:yes stop_codon:yes gene_type:complete